MAVIKYERGKDGVIRESVSNDGGKTYSQTGANSSNGYSGSAYKAPTVNNGSGQSGNKNAGSNNSNNGYWHENPDGSGKQYNNTDVGQWDTSGQKWSNVGGTQGVNYAISSDNGTIIATDSNGVQTRFLPTSQDYNSFYQNMLNDIKTAGNNYTPQNTFTNQNGTYTTKDYTAGNSDLQYALQQAAKTNPGISVGDYAESLYNRVGSTRSDGSMVTLDDVTKELTRLGLSDYLPGNAVFTSGQNLLPGNEFGRFGEDATGDEGQWYFYGGQQYRVGGDQDNFVDYVNGKTGNLKNNLSYIFNDMANNPYAQQDPEFLNAYLQGQGQFNTANGSITGNTNVDNVINYVNSINNFNQAMGTGSSDLWSEIKAMLQGGLESQQAFLASQRTQAEQNAEELARHAYVNNKLQGDGLKEALSASGLGTSGAMQSAQLGVQSNYNNILGEIRRNLNTMLSGLSEQELKALTDYTNNMTDYAYRIQNDEQDRAYQNAQLYMQQLEMQQNQQQQAWENAYKQQLLELDRQKYADNQAQYQDEIDYGKKLDSADYYSQIYNAEKMSTAEYQRVLRELGIIA